MKHTLKQPYQQFFGTLSNPCRIGIIEALDKGPLTVNQICKATGSNQTTISHNLRRLMVCGFVFVKPKGRERIYHLNSNTIKPLLSLMHKHMNAHCAKVVEGKHHDHS